MPEFFCPRCGGKMEHVEGPFDWHNFESLDASIYKCPTHGKWTIIEDVETGGISVHEQAV